MTRYDGYPDHPLCGVPQECLEVARKVLYAGAVEHDVDPDMVEPLADAVVAELAKAGWLGGWRTK